MDRCEVCGTFGPTVDGVLCEGCEADFWDESDREYEIQFGHEYL